MTEKNRIAFADCFFNIAVVVQASALLSKYF